MPLALPRSIDLPPTPVNIEKETSETKGTDGRIRQEKEVGTAGSDLSCLSPMRQDSGAVYYRRTGLAKAVY